MVVWRTYIEHNVKKPSQLCAKKKGKKKTTLEHLKSENHDIYRGRHWNPKYRMFQIG
jgi:hypothetical protein